MPTATKVRVRQADGEVTVSRGGVKLKTFTVKDGLISPQSNEDLELALTIPGAVREEPAKSSRGAGKGGSRGRTPTGAEGGDTASGDSAGDGSDASGDGE